MITDFLSLAYDPWVLDDCNIIQYLSQFIRTCIHRSSRKDRLIEVARQSIEKGIWYSCLQDSANWLDLERFAAIEILVSIIGPQDDVLNYSLLALYYTPDVGSTHRSRSWLR